MLFMIMRASATTEHASDPHPHLRATEEWWRGRPRNKDGWRNAMEFTQEHEGMRCGARRHSRAGGNPCNGPHPVASVS